VELTFENNATAAEFNLTIPVQDKVSETYPRITIGDLVNKDATRSTIDEPPALEALQFLQDLALKDKAIPVGANAAEGDAGFHTGRLGMWHYNSAHWARFHAVPDLRWNLVPIPTGKKGAIPRNPPKGYASWHGNKHPDDSWLVMEELSAPEALRALEGIPARTSMAESGDFAPAKVPGLKWQIWIDALKHGHDEPVTRYFEDMDQTLRAFSAELFSGKTTVRDWAGQARQKLDALLEGKGPQI
jgi:multiple sugar transport system substrate-binding protein